MVKEKEGKTMKLSRINRRLLLNDPKALLLYPQIRKIARKSMLSYTALYNAYQHVVSLEEKRIVGSIVEMGCWNGGCSALMASALKKNPLKRHVWLFDSFEGLPGLTQEDESWAKHLDIQVGKQDEAVQKPIGLYVADENAVKDAFAALNVPLENVHIVKGWFQKSVPTVRDQIGPIALLRLDGDTYESTKYCLTELYGRVVEGGIIIVDDYNLEGCRHALYEFFVERRIYPTIYFEPYGGRTHIVKY